MRITILLGTILLFLAGCTISDEKMPINIEPRSSMIEPEDGLWLRYNCSGISVMKNSHIIYGCGKDDESVRALAENIGPLSSPKNCAFTGWKADNGAWHGYVASP